ncbi:MAG: 3-hydroxyacyl-CoA dehydrogenase NAD-binding domain-containing protein [Cyclobacteriaceae bacterium]
MPQKNRKIKKVAVLGSGVMGSQIACHFANIGLDVLLLDIAPRELDDKEKSKGLSLEDTVVKNRIVNSALAFASKMKPAPLYKKEFISRVKTGNFTDDLPKIKHVDWIIEVVVENLDIKKKVFTDVEKYRTPGTLVTSNTSGIPIQEMSEGRSDDFQEHFCGTHFFNPPRYLKLLEIIPGPKTNPAIVDFLMHYGDLYLGKTTVKCKDTPAFIANRVGVYSILSILKTVEEMGLTVGEVDKLTGPVVGRPKSATFRTLDVVGNDTIVKVTNNLYEALPNDEVRDTFKLPAVLQKIDENKWYGQKVGQGFYKKVKGKDGKSNIQALNLSTFEYEDKQRVSFPTLEMTKTIDSVKGRFKVLIAGKDKAGEFYRKTFLDLFTYVSNRIPEISDDLYKLDDALRAGFGWEYGPFETWDAIGAEKVLSLMEEAKLTPAAWVTDMVKAGNTSFYRIEKGVKQYYDVTSKGYKAIPGLDQFILLDNLREDKIVWSNSGASLFDIGDGVLNLEFHSKMNSMGSEVLAGVNKAVDIAQEGYNGLVIANEATQAFSAGANLAMLLMNAVDQEFEEIDMMVRQFQRAVTRMRFSSIPCVVAPHNLALGGACELTMHADKAQVSAELYTGLVEMGVGLIPAGGGTKELTLRASDSIEDGDLALNNYQNAFLSIAMAKVSSSAQEAIENKILRTTDGITMNKSRQIADAKMAVLEMAEQGYTESIMRKDVQVYGKQLLGMLQAGANSYLAAGYISEYDHHLSMKVAYIMAGGDLSAPTKVSEQYLLDLEREAFLSLCGERKTVERIQYMLKTGKPLRN